MMHPRRRNPLSMLGELRGYLLGVGLVLCMVATAVVLLPQPQKVNAFPGRDPYKGYFYSNPATSGNKVISNVQTDYPQGKGLIGVETTDQFINAIGYLLNSQYNPNDQTGAAFIVLDMLGFSPGTATIQTAKDNFSTWSAGVRNAQSIEFNFNFSYKINTYYQPPNAPYGGDVAWYYQTAQANSIVINWKEGGRYAIKKDCGNPVGDLDTIKSIPNYLSALHVDETNPLAKVLMPSNDLNNNISCPSPYTCTTVSRQGNSYSIQLNPNKYTVSNTNTPIGYTYIGWELYKNGGGIPIATGLAPTIPPDFIIDQTVNKNYAIVWRYKKNPAQNCLQPSQTVGINEPALLTSTVTPNVFTTNVWSAGFGNPTTGNGPSFTVSYAAVGNFPVTLTVNGTTSICYVVVTQKPYIRAYGGDIFAGSPICTGWPASGGIAGIYGFPGTTAGTGSGAQLGVLAMGPVWGFNSAMLRTTGSGIPQPPNDLTFASGPSPGNVVVSRCPYDYWGKKTITSNNVGPSPISLSTYFAGEYYAGSTISINSTTIPNSKVINLYVNGDLVILQNIIYQNATGATAWTSVDQIPRLQIVATGNIYIAKDVTQLDGIYVAQGGTIYTCTNGSTLYLAPTLYTNCNKQLLVNGALLATKIKWLRTFGHVGDSTASENPNTTPRNCTSIAVDLKPTCASEVVNLGPEAWMVGPSSTSPTADYIQALPPLL